MLIWVWMEIVLSLTQDRCTVYAKHSIGSEIIWPHPVVLLGDVGHVEPRFDLFGDSVSVGASQVHGLCKTYHRVSICFGVPDGSPR